MKSTAKLIAVPNLERAPQGLHEPFVAECVNATHPTLTGRVKARWTNAGVEIVCWVAALRGLAVRDGDRLLITRPHNWDEPIVFGVIDGYARRPRPVRDHAATIDLRSDEAICIRNAGGKPLFELTDGERGAEITFLQQDASLQVEGKLNIEAKALSIKAHEGEVAIEASDDVVVAGENIHLN